MYHRDVHSILVSNYVGVFAAGFAGSESIEVMTPHSLQDSLVGSRLLATYPVGCLGGDTFEASRSSIIGRPHGQQQRQRHLCSAHLAGRVITNMPAQVMEAR